MVAETASVTAVIAEEEVAGRLSAGVAAPSYKIKISKLKTVYHSVLLRYQL